MSVLEKEGFCQQPTQEFAMRDADPRVGSEKIEAELGQRGLNNVAHQPVDRCRCQHGRTLIGGVIQSRDIAEGGRCGGGGGGWIERV